MKRYNTLVLGGCLPSKAFREIFRGSLRLFDTVDAQLNIELVVSFNQHPKSIFRYLNEISNKTYKPSVLIDDIGYAHLLYDSFDNFNIAAVDFNKKIKKVEDLYFIQTLDLYGDNLELWSKLFTNNLPKLESINANDIA